MTWELIFVAILLVGALVSFAWERWSPDQTAYCVFAILVLAALVTHSPRLPRLEDLLGVFANQAALTVGAIFVLSATLENCGAIEWIAERLETFGEQRLGYIGILGVIMLAVVAISAFMNNTAVVVIFLPVVMGVANRRKMAPSKFLIPLSYAAIFGGCCTAIGTSTNLLLSGVMQAENLKPLGMFELTPLGAPLAMAGIVYVLSVAKPLLPTRSVLSSILTRSERREYITEAIVHAQSSMIGKSLQETGLLKMRAGRLLEIVRDGVSYSISSEDFVMQAGDRLIMACKATGIMEARTLEGVEFLSDRGLDLEQITAHEGVIVEAVLGPRSSLQGKTLREINFRQRYRTLILAVHRNGHNLRDKLDKLTLEFGDTLLLLGTEAALEAMRLNENIILLDHVPMLAKSRSKKLPWVVGVGVAAVIAASTDMVPMVGAMLVAVGVLLLMGAIRPKEAYQAIDWRVLILLYSMLGLGVAMEQSGLSEWMAAGMAKGCAYWVPESMRPWVMLAVIYGATLLMTELLSNNATVLMMAPIGIELAEALAVDVRPFLIAVCIAASAGFMNPIGYQTHTYVYSVGGYRFKDFLKIGSGLNLVYWVLTVALIPRIWSFA